MKEFLKENKFVILTLLIVGLLTYGIRIVFETISIDTECIMIYPDSLYAGWLAIGRYILVFIKNLEFIPFNIRLSNIATFLIFFLSILVWMRQLETLFQKRNKIANLLFGLLLLTTPILAEQFSYTLQNVEVAFAFLLFAIGMGTIQKAIYDHSIKHSILTVLLFIIPFGVYQGFVPLFLTLCAFIYIVREKEEKQTKESFKRGVQYIGIFIIILGLYYLGNYIVQSVLGIQSASYLKEQIFWGKEPISDTIVRMIKSVGAVVCGYGIKYNLLYIVTTFILLFCLYKQKEKKKNNLFYLATLFLIITPFLLTIFMGNGGAYRMRFNLIFTVAFLVYYLINNIQEGNLKKFFIIFVIVEIILQAMVTIMLFYSDVLRFEEDKQLAQEINERINSEGIDRNKPVIFLGKHSAKKSIIKGEVLGYSFYEWDMETPQRNNIRIHGFLNTQGIFYKQPTIEEAVETNKEEVNLENWPSDNAIRETDKYVLVKLED